VPRGRGHCTLDWAQRSYENIYCCNTHIKVGLVGAGDIEFFMPKGKNNCPEASITYIGPLKPPIRQGAQVAELQVVCNGQLTETVPLFAADSVADGSFMNKAMAGLKQLAFGWL
jgi:D-alanyl-D-alanine carboxypeptidase (penicillin-binding protein 5/6)